jgi:hypothetical protein
MTNWASMNAFRARADLERYGDNALLLYALELRHNIGDIHAVAAEALTDGTDDKKCDLVYIDRDTRTAVVAQGYVAQKTKKEAPANKASDLNTAAAWLLTASLSSLPEQIRSAAKELRSAIKDGDIEVLEFWYVHNCNISKNVNRELATVQTASRAKIDSKFSGSKCHEVRATEIGLETLEEWYKTTKTAILVGHTFKVSVPGGYETSAAKWSAFTTAVPASWLYELYKKYGADLFSANVRDYLGSRKSDSNINHGIKESAASQPSDSWAFNNGITALVNDFSLKHDRLRINGISIMNGAQTTGALGSLPNPPEATAMVPARFIRCSDGELVQGIIRFNNSQNKIAPADFRSTDAVQERLRAEFSSRTPTITYLGGRRGGADDAIRRNVGSHIPSDTAAQSLTAFHQNPGLAYSRKGDIWESDQYYSRIFNEKTHAEHIIFVYSLFGVLSEHKLVLQEKASNEERMTEAEKGTLSFFRLRGSIHLLMAAIGACMEVFVEETVSSKFDLKFKKKLSLADSLDAWRPVVACCVPFHAALRSLLEQSIPVGGDISGPISQFRSLVEATRAANQSIYRTFASTVEVNRLSVKVEGKKKRDA